jgi:hypothetical protein
MLITTIIPLTQIKLPSRGQIYIFTMNTVSILMIIPVIIIIIMYYFNASQIMRHQQ